MEEINDYRDLKAELKLTAANLKKREDVNVIEAKITEEFRQILNDIVQGIDEESPQKIFKKALGSFDKIERKEFIVANLLEALKRGEGVKQIAERFTNLGLLIFSKEELDTLPAEPEQTSSSSNKKPKPTVTHSLTSFLLNFQNNPIKSTKVLLTRLLNRVVRKLPEVVKVRPKFSIAFPFIPILHFDTDDSMSVEKILTLIQDAIEESNSGILGG